MLLFHIGTLSGLENTGILTRINRMQYIRKKIIQTGIRMYGKSEYGSVQIFPYMRLTLYGTRILLTVYTDRIILDPYTSDPYIRVNDIRFRFHCCPYY